MIGIERLWAKSINRRKFNLPNIEEEIQVWKNKSKGWGQKKVKKERIIILISLKEPLAVME